MHSGNSGTNVVYGVVCVIAAAVGGDVVVIVDGVLMLFLFFVDGVVLGCREQVLQLPEAAQPLRLPQAGQGQ